MSAHSQGTAHRAHKALVLAPRPSTKPVAAQRSVAPKRTRASKPKVRTGCRTCKIRRVKCDEGKPICQQCQKGGIVCDGYVLDALTKTNLTKAGALTASTTRPGQLRFVLHPKPSSAPSSRRFNSEEVPYIDFFRHALTVDLAGYSCTDFWSRVVLCEAMTSDCVRNAVLAIAALSAGISDSLTSRRETRTKPSALFPWTARTVVNDKHRAALQHYVQALSLFRKQVDVEVEIRSPRSVLIMSLLLITFELIQGNMGTVDSLMTSSIKLLKGSLTQYRQDALTPSKCPPYRTEDDVRDIEHILPFLSIMGAFTPFLKTQRENLALWDTSPDKYFPTLNPRDAKQLQTEWSRFFARASAFTGQAFTTITQTHPPSVPPALVDQQQTYLTHLSKWDAILNTAFVDATTPQTQHSIRLMQLHRLTLLIGINCCLDATDMAWDLHDTEFQTIIDETLSLYLSTSSPLASDPSVHSASPFLSPSSRPQSQILRSKDKPKYHANFTLSMGILSTLGPAITKCRTHSIRMRALTIARLMPWREGAWDAEAELYGKLGGVLLEEQGRGVDGRIPAEERWNWVEGRWDREWDGGRGRLVGVYVGSLRGEGGDVVVRTLEVGLDGWVDVCGMVGCGEDHGRGLEGLGRGLDSG